MLPDRTPEDYARYRIDKAKKWLHDAKVPDNSFETAANRSYYCIFSAMRAVLALDRFNSKKGIYIFYSVNRSPAAVFSAEFP